MELSEIKKGDTFKIGDIEFIKFGTRNGNVTAVTKDVVFYTYFGKSNNFAESFVLNRLQKEFLPKVEALVGKENLVEFDTNLFTLDGLKDYKSIRSKVSLPTFDFYRINREIFENYKLDSWWWLATANGGCWETCVSPNGNVLYGNLCINLGVRPILHFVSSISVSQ